MKTMISFSRFICICNLILFIKPIISQQAYDSTGCSAAEQAPGSKYVCISQKTSCDTYIVYRARDGYQTLSSIASLFNASITQLLSSNNMPELNSNNLRHGQEIIIPVTCSCSDSFSQASFLYNASQSDSLYKVACEVYEGLVKEQVLIEENPNFSVHDPTSSLVQVPLRCACPDESDIGNGTIYFVTYPVVKDDRISLIAHKFGVTENVIQYANTLDTFGTIYPQTTLLIPTKDVPVLSTNQTSPSQNPSPSPRGVVLDVFPGKESSDRSLRVFLIGGLSALLFLIILACGVLVFNRKRNHLRKFQPLSAKSPQLLNFSPDLFDGMSKLKTSLMSFSLEELKIATKDFSQASVMGTSVYRGRIGSSYFAIEKMNSKESANHVIGILTKINHVSLIKLEGYCCGTTKTYLVYEFVENGSLRDCLSNVKMAKQLNWAMRMQIAFDLAVGLYYIHFCTKPAYVHKNINSKNVLITKDWRAKITGFKWAKPLIYKEEKEEPNWIESVIVGQKGYLSPEYLTCGQASTKVDVYAFGVVLLEILSGKVARGDDNVLKDSTTFLVDGLLEDSSRCLEKLKRFIDPALEGDYPLGDAMCLALLAKGCLGEDPLHRPTMNDVLKALSRIC